MTRLQASAEIMDLQKEASLPTTNITGKLLLNMRIAKLMKRYNVASNGVLNTKNK